MSTPYIDFSLNETGHLEYSLNRLQNDDTFILLSALKNYQTSMQEAVLRITKQSEGASETILMASNSVIKDLREKYARVIQLHKILDSSIRK